jgi:uncharacterized protein (TIGR00730 family)
MIKSVCLFCGSQYGNSENILKQVNLLCEELVSKGYELVYGGGKNGLMGVVADIFLKHHRKVIGVRPKKLITEEGMHEKLNKLIVVDDMFERKKKMIELADVFITIPGGVGTLDELFDVFTQKKIGFNDKVCAVFNPEGFYNQLDSQLETMIKFGFLKAEDKAKLIIESDIDTLMNRIG